MSNGEYVILENRKNSSMKVQARVVSLSRRILTVRINGSEIGFRRADGTVSWGNDEWNLSARDLSWYAPQNDRFSTRCND